MKKLADSKQLFRNIFSNKRHFVIFLLGFASGLPAALTASTLQAWLTDAGINLKTIGATSLLVLPYSTRFLWSAFFDYYYLPGFDRRISWLYILQACLFISITCMSFLTPTASVYFWHLHLPLLVVIGFITAFLSASQDIVINAYQTEVLPVEEYGLGASIYVVGWRISVIIAGALALVLAANVGWHITYLCMACLMSIGLLGTYLAPYPKIKIHKPKSLFYAAYLPLKELFLRFGFKATCIFFILIITYKAGDALALALNTTFLLRHVGFDLATIGLVNKTVSLVAALVGGIVAGIWMTRLSLYQALMLFGFIQGAANLSYAALAYFGKGFFLLVLTAFIENFCSGMGTIALLALIMALCNVEYTATQFAILNAIAFIARTFVGPVAAYMVEQYGWLLFFIICFICSLPTLIFVYWNKNIIDKLNKKTNKAIT